MPEEAIPHRRRNDALGVATITGVTAATALAGRASGDYHSRWHRLLRKPAADPPGSVFAIVWGTLYVLTALSAVLLWLRRGQARHRNALVGLFLLQYLLNFAFTPILTRQHQLRLALADCALLDAVVIAMTALAWPVRRSAGLLLLPYVLWADFATFLSWRLWKLNPHPRRSWPRLRG